jgi:hypothetical protein
MSEPQHAAPARDEVPIDSGDGKNGGDRQQSEGGERHPMVRDR